MPIYRNAVLLQQNRLTLQLPEPYLSIMKPLITLLLPLLLLSFKTLSQVKIQGGVRGQLKDSKTGQPLVDASLAVLKASDSSMVTLVFSGADGHFSLGRLDTGSYRLHITYLGYKPRLIPVDLTLGNIQRSLGVLFLEAGGLTLKEVEVKQVRSAVTVKKDTLEFNADNYKVRQNGDLEGLLKKLPGIHVDRHGSVEAQGKTITRILIDGRPFFNDNPRMALKNISAEMIEKVQVIDKKSGQAAFTGIEDGSSEKVINITVKKDWKRNLIGRLSGGSGSDKRYNANLNLNRFSEAQQMTIIGGSNNINNLAGEETGAGSRSPSAAISNNGQDGINRLTSGALNFNRDIGKNNKLHVSYFHNNNATEIERTNSRQNLLPDTSFFYDQKSNDKSKAGNHIFYVQGESNLDSMSSLLLTSNTAFITAEMHAENLYRSTDVHQQMINSGNSRITSLRDIMNTNNELLFKRRLLKKGRTISVLLNYHNNTSDQVDVNSSDNFYQKPGGEVLLDSINQRIWTNGREQNIGTRIVYTEPIFKERYLEISYAFYHALDAKSRETFNYNKRTGEFDELNDSLSNRFRNIFKTQTLGLALATIKENYSYTVGLNFQMLDQDLNNFSLGERFTRNARNFLPFASFNYNLKTGRQFRIDYTGNPEQPDISQLQPVIDNTNPLYVKLGNPQLKQAFTHSLGLGYNSLNPDKGWAFSSTLTGLFTSNKMVDLTRIDSLGRQVSLPTNANGFYNVGAQITNSFPLSKKNANLNTITSFNVVRDISYINGARSATNNYSLFQSININYAYEELFDFAVTGSVHYSGARYPLQKEQNTSYTTYALSFDGQLNLPAGMLLGIDLDYMLNTGRTANYNLDILILNAFIAKTLFPGKQALLKLQGFDLLKQNTSIRRNTGPNFIEDTRSTVLQRFFLLSFTYFLKPAEKK
jgi:hypothetical protein